MKKSLYLSLFSLAVLSVACQPQQAPANPSASNTSSQASSDRILTITSETIDPKLPKVLVPGLELKVFAGSGKSGYKDGPKLEAEFKSIGDMAQDDEGNLYISDYEDFRIRKIDTQGQVSTLAGTGIKALNSKIGSFSETEFDSLGFLINGPANQLYVSNDTATHIFRVNLNSQQIDLFMIEAHYPDLPPTFETNKLPIVFPPSKSLTFYREFLYIGLSSEIWKLTQSDQNYHLERYAGNAAVDPTGGSIDDARRNFKDGPPDDSKFNNPSGLVFDRAGNLFVSDFSNHRIRKVAAGTREVSTLSGQGIPSSSTIAQFYLGGFRDGPLNEAQFNHPTALALTEAEDLIVQDSNKNGALRLLSQGQVRTIIQNCPCHLLKDKQQNRLYVLHNKSLQIFALDLSQLEKLKPQILKQEPQP